MNRIKRTINETRFIHLKAESSQRLDPVSFTAPNPEGYFLLVNQGVHRELNKADYK